MLLGGRRLPSLRAVFAAAIVLSTAAAPVPAVASPIGPLLRAQDRLDRLSVVVGAYTAAWMGLRPQIAPHRARIWAIRKELRASLTGTSTIVRERRDLLRSELRAEVSELAPLWPSWIRVKAVLHRAHRLIEKALREPRALVRAFVREEPDPDAASTWLEIWPTRVNPGAAIGVCPVEGPNAFIDSFGAPRPGGRFHEGEDLLTARGTPVLAVTDGEVVQRPNSLGGNAILLYADGGGYMYYAHFDAYAKTGRVEVGDVVGYAGNSGNAKGLIPHVHFEYHPPGSDAVDTYRDLLAVC